MEVRVTRSRLPLKMRSAAFARNEKYTNRTQYLFSDGTLIGWTDMPGFRLQRTRLQSDLLRCGSQRTM